MSLQLGMFIVIGLINTLITLAMIFCLRKLDFSLYFSNAVGYMLGVVTSYVLNSMFTFSVQFGVMRFSKFIITVLLSYAVNIAFINTVMFSFNVNEIYAQLGGMFSYTACCFILNKKWVMK